MYIYIYTYIHNVYVYIHIYIHIYTHIYVYIYIYKIRARKMTEPLKAGCITKQMSSVPTPPPTALSCLQSKGKGRQISCVQGQPVLQREFQGSQGYTETLFQITTTTTTTTMTTTNKQKPKTGCPKNNT
jgi:hypothetical protein